MRAIALFMALAVLTPAVGLAASAAPVQVRRVQLDADAARTELVLSLSAPAEHSLFTLGQPDRVVIDVEHARLETRLPAGQGIVSALRSGTHDDGLRLVLDVSAHTTPRSFLRYGSAGPELVIDLYSGTQAAQPVSAVPVAAAVPAAVVANTAPVPLSRGRDIVIAIDAGHGGRDPGAHGPHGALEKNATLAIARRLAALIDQQPGMKAVLTRDSDVLVDLKDRFERARRANADLFISIHCDASRDHSADGATVYVLSEHGATTEHTRWLMRQEDNIDLLGGVVLSDKPPEVQSLIVDMSQSAVLGMSFDVGASVAKQLSAIGAMHRNSVQQAGFMVLKAPDMPSMLIETNYITNPAAARELMSADYQQSLAKAIMTGVSSYFERYPPAGSAPAVSKAQQRGSAAAEVVAAANLPRERR